MTSTEKYTIKITTNPDFEIAFNRYPDDIRKKLGFISNLIRETANNALEVKSLEETLKWNEPSFISPVGSTVRIDWKEKTPNQYAIYFKCTSKLVPTFKIFFSTVFKFEGTRAIVFDRNETIPVNELKICIKTALIYHKVKHLPYLSIG